MKYKLGISLLLIVTVNLSEGHVVKGLNGGSFSSSYSSASASASASSYSSSSSGSFPPGGALGLNNIDNPVKGGPFIGSSSYASASSSANAHASGVGNSGLGASAKAGASANAGALAGAGANAGTGANAGVGANAGAGAIAGAGASAGFGTGAIAGSSSGAGGNAGLGANSGSASDGKYVAASDGHNSKNNGVIGFGSFGGSLGGSHGSGGLSKSDADTSSNAISGSNSYDTGDLDKTGGSTSGINTVAPSGGFQSGSRTSPGKYNSGIYVPGSIGGPLGSGDLAASGSYPSSNKLTGVKTHGIAGCCKGPFPGPKGSIYNSKPAPPGGGGPDPAWLTTGTGSSVTTADSGSGGTYNSIPNSPSSGINHGIISTLPGSSGSIYNSKPITGSTYPASGTYNKPPLVHGTGVTPSGVIGIIGTLPGPSGSIYDSKPAPGVTNVPLGSVSGAFGSSSSGESYNQHTTSGNGFTHGVSDAPFGVTPSSVPNIIGTLPGPSGSIYASKPVSGAGATTDAGSSGSVSGAFGSSNSGSSYNQHTTFGSGSAHGVSDIPIGVTPSSVSNIIGTLPGPSGSIYASKPVSGVGATADAGSNGVSGSISGAFGSSSSGGSYNQHTTSGSGSAHGVSGIPVGVTPSSVPGLIGTLPGPSDSIYASKPVSGAGATADAGSDGSGSTVSTPSGGTYTVVGSYSDKQSGIGSTAGSSGLSGGLIGSLPGPSGSIYDSKPASGFLSENGHPSSGLSHSGYVSLPVKAGTGIPIFGPICQYTQGTKGKDKTTGCAGTAISGGGYVNPGLLPSGPGSTVGISGYGSHPNTLPIAYPGSPIAVTDGPISGHLTNGASGSFGVSSGDSGPIPAFGSICKYIPGTKDIGCSGSIPGKTGPVIPIPGTVVTGGGLPSFGQADGGSVADANANANAGSSSGHYPGSPPVSSSGIPSISGSLVPGVILKPNVPTSGSSPSGSGECCKGPFPGPNRGIHDNKPVFVATGSTSSSEAEVKVNEGSSTLSEFAGSNSEIDNGGDNGIFNPSTSSIGFESSTGSTSSGSSSGSENGFATGSVEVQKPGENFVKKEHKEFSPNSDTFYDKSGSGGFHFGISPGSYQKPNEGETGELVVSGPGTGGLPIDGSSTVSYGGPDSFEFGIGGSSSTTGVSSVGGSETDKTDKDFVTGHINIHQQDNSGTSANDKPGSFSGSGSGCSGETGSICSSSNKPTEGTGVSSSSSSNTFGIGGDVEVESGSSSTDKSSGGSTVGRVESESTESGSGSGGLSSGSTSAGNGGAGIGTEKSSDGFATGSVTIHKPDGSTTSGKDSHGSTSGVSGSGGFYSPSSGTTSGGFGVGGVSTGSSGSGSGVSHGSSIGGVAGGNGFATGSVIVHKPDGSTTSGNDSPGSISGGSGSSGSSGSSAGTVSGGIGGGGTGSGGSGSNAASGSFSGGYHGGLGHGSGSGCSSGSCIPGAFGFGGSFGNGFGQGFGFSGSGSGSNYHGVKGGGGSLYSGSTSGAGAGFVGDFDKLFGQHGFGASFSKASSFANAGASSGSFAKAGSVAGASSHSSATARAGSSSY